VLKSGRHEVRGDLPRKIIDLAELDREDSVERDLKRAF
jgi:hypothetical protein